MRADPLDAWERGGSSLMLPDSRLHMTVIGGGGDGKALEELAFIIHSPSGSSNGFWKGLVKAFV